MNRPGDAELPVRTRAALLDALEALEGQLDTLIVIGAQALYMHAGEADVARTPRRSRAAARARLDAAHTGTGGHHHRQRPSVDLVVADTEMAVR